MNKKSFSLKSSPSGSISIASECKVNAAGIAVILLTSFEATFDQFMLWMENYWAFHMSLFQPTEKQS